MILDKKNRAPESTDTKLNLLAETNNKADDFVKGVLRRIQRNGSLVRMLIIAGVVFTIFAMINSRIFLGPINLNNLMTASPEIGILAIAMALSMLVAGIDLSVISTASLTAVTILMLYGEMAATDPAGAESMGFVFLLIGLGVGLACGLFNGFLIGYVGITPILATLGTMQLYNGLAIVWTGGRTLTGAPEILPAFGQASTLGIPNLFILLIVVAIVISIVITRTPFGARMRLLGANQLAATYSGLGSKRILLQTYMMTGLLAAVAGLAFLARNPTLNADYGRSYLLLIIVIVVLGGTNPNGGFASIWGVVIAVLTLQMISSGFNMLRLSAYEYQIAQGVILVLVMVLDQVNWKRKKKNPGAVASAPPAAPVQQS